MRSEISSLRQERDNAKSELSNLKSKVSNTYPLIITDIEIGLPSSFAEVMVMIVGYLTDIIYGVVAYIIAIFIFNLLYDFFTRFFSQKNKKAEENNSSALFENDNLSE